MGHFSNSVASASSPGTGAAVIGGSAVSARMPAISDAVYSQARTVANPSLQALRCMQMALIEDR
jgi:hypothetical protein